MSNASNSKQYRKGSRSSRVNNRIASVVGIANQKELSEGATKIPGKARNDKCELVPTSGEVLRDGSFLELVRDSATGAERVLHWNEGRSKIAPEHGFEGRCYVPTEGAAILRHLPSEPTPCGSTKILFNDVCKFAARSLTVNEDEAALLASLLFCILFLRLFDDVTVLAAIRPFLLGCCVRPAFPRLHVPSSRTTGRIHLTCFALRAKTDPPDMPARPPPKPALGCAAVSRIRDFRSRSPTGQRCCRDLRWRDGIEIIVCGCWSLDARAADAPLFLHAG